MNGNLKRGLGGLAILFAIFCVAVIINYFLDRSSDDDIILNKSAEESTTFDDVTEVNSEESTEIASEVSGDGFNGYRRLEEKNGDVYDGQWKNGNYNGDGVFSRKTGEIYDGQWIDGAFDKGKITYKINNFGGTRTVEIDNTKEWNGNGKNALILESGEIYDGQWLNDKRNGDGTLYTRGKHEVPTKIQTGIWDNDILVDGTETSLLIDGETTYVVQIKDGFRNGKGITYDKDGNIVKEEQWLDDNVIE